MSCTMLSNLYTKLYELQRIIKPLYQIMSYIVLSNFIPNYMSYTMLSNLYTKLFDLTILTNLCTKLYEVMCYRWLMQVKLMG